MKQIYALFISCLLIPASVIAQSSSGVTLWGQCGGVGYTGPTQCAQPNFPQVVIKCKPLGPHFSQCQDISDRTCIKVACKCPVGYVTEWYTGPEPKRCRLCKCVPVTSSTKPTPTPTSTFISTTTPSTSASSSQVIYPYYPPAPITSSSCPATIGPKTCSSPAGSFTQTATVITPGTATICAQGWCQCAIWDCFCQPPAVYVPVISGACQACTCSTPTQILIDPTGKPNLGKDSNGLSVITTAFVEAAARYQETVAADDGSTWRKRAAMPEATQN